MKSEEKTAAKTAQISAGWSAPPAEIGPASGQSAYQEVDEDYGWNVDSAEPVKRPNRSLPEEDWLDHEVDPPPQVDDLSEASTIVIYRKPPGSGMSAWAFLAVVLAACLVIMVVRIQSSLPSKSLPTTAASSTNASALSEADTWLKSAGESMEKKDYELATAQLENALRLLKKGQAPQTAILSTRKDLAAAHELSGELKEAHKQWSNLQSSDPEAKTKTVALEKKLRVGANKLLEQSLAARKAGQYRKAEKLADEAQDIYKSYGGSREQIASSLEYAARADLADGNVVAAESNLQLAQKYSWNQARADLLARMAPRTNVAPSRPSRRPTLGQPSSIPQGTRPVEPEYPQAVKSAPTVSTQVKAPTYQQQPEVAPPIQYQPPVNSPAYNSGTNEETEHLGNEGVLESYKTSGPRTGKSGVPGYR